jgi:hypothetical protein
MTEDELQALLEKTLPAADLHGLFVEECQDQDVRLRFSPTPDGDWTMAALLSLVDTSLRATAGVTAKLTHLTVTVLRPAQQADVIAETAIPCTPKRGCSATPSLSRCCMRPQACRGRRLDDGIDQAGGIRIFWPGKIRLASLITSRLASKIFGYLLASL